MIATERGERSVWRKRRGSCSPRKRGEARSLRGIGMAAAALVEAAIEHVLGDAVLENLDRAAGDHPATATPHAIFHQRRATVTGGAHDLHGLVRDLEADLVAGCFRYRGLI